jgi:hypothetical protein
MLLDTGLLPLLRNQKDTAQSERVQVLPLALEYSVD